MNHLETCAKTGKTPQKPYSGRMMFRVSPEVHRKAALAAELAGMSLNQWAEKVLVRASE
ncbi:type II toxin-antitoxin system HicB family antitoxin [Pusillimonas noertemannii]|uniref:type II toxin-antitoxin system HicB family antitoxin n=1 Tax=Pusillimonas noertemannii TaxID=305977 RepID=UPI000E3049AB|nr:type II toxin-antitoxin system HicB family antitoxin [Pusillimonas noertemannii]NYT69997.1 type II toxin-antitoxin system HicB family antitoxin [Pusillimonas noertemannii]TFL08394.1 type II toxin-antitoxin system HicB family antitoxin [Pusillimonas noertemannii]